MSRKRPSTGSLTPFVTCFPPPLLSAQDKPPSLPLPLHPPSAANPRGSSSSQALPSDPVKPPTGESQQARPGDWRVMDAASVDALLQKQESLRSEAKVSLVEQFECLSKAIAGSTLAGEAAWQVVSLFLETPMWVPACEAVYTRLCTAADKADFTERLEGYHRARLGRGGRASAWRGRGRGPQSEHSVASTGSRSNDESLTM